MTPDTAPTPTRFRLTRTDTGAWQAHDRLLPGQHRTLPAAQLPEGDDAATAAKRFRLAFLPRTLPHALRAPAARPGGAGDPLFWQFPARTEAIAFSAHHASQGAAALQNDAAQAYLGMPWATFIDLENRHGARPEAAAQEIFMQRVRIGGWRAALQGHGLGFRVHTVCQHVYWRQLLPTWAEMGVTDVWLSHAPPGCTDDEAARLGLTLHPWRLFAVNWEDETRREGLAAGRDPADKPVLASFMGAHADHYPSDIRLRLLAAFATEPDFVLRRTGQWHFEHIVYQHQVHGQPLPADRSEEHRDRLDYNRLLSDSVFALCPAGAGPNTLRLWEALAVGSIPVLLGPAPELPHGGTLPAIDWDAVVLRVAEGDDLAALPARLRAMPLHERRTRQQRGLAAFAAVQQQRCFA